MILPYLATRLSPCHAHLCLCNHLCRSSAWRSGSGRAGDDGGLWAIGGLCPWRAVAHDAARPSSNIVRAEFRARVETQLPGLTVELEHSRGPLMAEPLAAAALDWATALTASVVPELHPYPTVHSALDGLLIAIEAAPAARGWAGALVSYEALILSALGFGHGDGGRPDDWPDVLASLNQSGARLDRYLFSDRRADVLAARERLVERLKRAAA